jgi:hypothetical protein
MSFGALFLWSWWLILIGTILYTLRRHQGPVVREPRLYYVFCATKHYPSRPILWTGPYETEEEAKAEIEDSRERRLVGRHDSLYVVDVIPGSVRPDGVPSIPPPPRLPTFDESIPVFASSSATPHDEPSLDDEPWA